MKLRHLTPLLLAILTLAVLPRLSFQSEARLEHALQTRVLPALADSLLAIEPGGAVLPALTAPDRQAAQLREGLQDILAERGGLGASDGDALPVLIRLSWREEGDRLHLDTSISSRLGSSYSRRRIDLPGWKSLVAPLVAILLAFAFRRTILCLLIGIWAGASLHVGDPLRAMVWLVYDGIIRHSLMDTFRLEILVFIFGLVGTVGIASRMGGIAGMLRAAGRVARGIRSSQVFAFAMGLLVFFDDYANTLLVGTTMRPLTDRWRISRERLAYIVDSTAAPVAGLSVLSTWVAYEMSLYAAQLPAAGLDQDPYIVFIRTLPFRFYSIFTLALVLFSSATGRNFGPMLKAEKRARSGQVMPDDGESETTRASQALRRSAMKEGLPPRWVNAALPLAVIISTALLLIFHFGDIESRGLAALTDIAYLRDTVLSNAQSARALAWASVLGFVVALALARTQRLLTLREAIGAGIGNFRALLGAVGILILAWTMGHLSMEMETSRALLALAGDGNAAAATFFPLLLFMLAAAVSFATGSSWSTMAILLPNVVILAASLGAASALGGELMILLSIGAVLEGSIFGDHCSPISDTTILSSVASGCPHMAHVKTQIPYALTALSAAVLAGYLPAALGVSPAISLPLGISLVFVTLITIGRRAEKAVAGNS